MKRGHSGILLIGYGNEFRQDDGVGLFIIRELKARHLPWVTLQEYQGEGFALLDLWDGYKSVILFDAVSSGAQPGTIHRIEPFKEPLPKYLYCSTHAFSLAEVIGLACSLHQLPEQLEIYGIEGKSFSQGQTISGEVRKAAGDVIEEVVKRLDRAHELLQST